MSPKINWNKPNIFLLTGVCAFLIVPSLEAQYIEKYGLSEYSNGSFKSSEIRGELPVPINTTSIVVEISLNDRFENRYLLIHSDTVTLKSNAHDMEEAKSSQLIMVDSSVNTVSFFLGNGIKSPEDVYFIFMKVPPVKNQDTSHKKKLFFL